MPAPAPASSPAAAYCTRLVCLLALALALAAPPPGATAMECYVCNGQEGNRDKCIKTSRQCLPHENACFSLIEYRLPTQYWQQNGIRTHFINKNCTTLDKCRTDSDDMAIQCNREWYNDWTCLECCSGELCNFYTTMSAGGLVPSRLAVWLPASLASLCLLRMLQQ